MQDTITNTPQPTFSSGLGNFYLNIKYDDSMVPITPLRLVTILHYHQLN